MMNNLLDKEDLVLMHNAVIDELDVLQRVIDHANEVLGDMSKDIICMTADLIQKYVVLDEKLKRLITKEDE